MKFWSPKVQTEENTWSVILHPLKGELDKKRAAEKISELFRLSFEEARELVQSTPLIVLDRLSQEQALGLQNIFGEVRAEVTLTRDSVVTRRCYRAVWPQTPDLSFLDHRSARRAQTPVSIPSDPPSPVQEEKASPFSEGLSRLDRKYQELQILYEQRTGEIQELKRNFEKEIRERVEKESSSLRTSLLDWEERYQNLRDEYQETKSIYEEKLLQQKQEIESLRTQLKDLGLWQEKATDMTREIEEHEKAQERAAVLGRELEGSREALKSYEEKNLARERELEAQREVGRRQEEKISALEKETESFKVQVKELEIWQEKADGLGRQLEEQEKARIAYEEKIYCQEAESNSLKFQLKDLVFWKEKAAQLERQAKSFSERIQELESAGEGLERSLREQTDTVNLWREKYQALAHKAERFEALYEEERKRRSEVEESRRQIEESRRKMAELAEHTRLELEAQTVETEKWREKYQRFEAKQKHLEEEFARFTEEQNAEAKRLRETNSELGRELENSQRQVRELLARVEQLDLVEKRNRLTTELSAKEARLRELALEGERLRQEIQDRELRSQTIGGEQANLEREVLEVKQAQRYLLEQSKLREKNHKLKRPNHHNHSHPQSLEANELGVDNG